MLMYRLLANVPCGWQDIRRELGIDIIEEQTVQLSKVMHPAVYIFNGMIFKTDICMF